MNENLQGFSVMLTDIFGYTHNRNFTSEKDAIANARKRFGFETFFIAVSVTNSVTGEVCYHEERRGF